MKARHLMDEGNYFDCVVLLRRQKVDLNYVVDYNPGQFLQHCGAFVRKSLIANADLVSLLISALESNTWSLWKYAYQKLPVNQISQPQQEQDGPVDVGDETEAKAASSTHTHTHTIAKQLGASIELNGAQKVNTVCGALREELLIAIHNGNTLALNPALCSYAKQMPPLLAEALELVYSVYCPSDKAVTANRSAVLSSSKVQLAIKYLSFLADGSVIFDAALGTMYPIYPIVSMLSLCLMARTFSSNNNCICYIISLYS